MRARQVGGSLHGCKEVLGLGKVSLGRDDIPLGGGQLAPREVRATELPAGTQDVEDLQCLLQSLLGGDSFASQPMRYPPSAVGNGLIEQMPIT